MKTKTQFAYYYIPLRGLEWCVPKNDVAKLNNRHKYIIIYYIILILHESASLLLYMNIPTQAFSCFAK